MSLYNIINFILPPLLAAFASLLLSRITGQSVQGWQLILLFFWLMQVVLTLLYRTRIDKPDFPAFLLACVVVRLILSLVLLVLLSVFSAEFTPLAFHFLLQFLIFTIAEILYVSKKMKLVKTSHK